TPNHSDADATRDTDARAWRPPTPPPPHPDRSRASIAHFGGEVHVQTKDGRLLSAKVDRPLGRGPEKPLPRSRLEAKFLDCASRALEPAGTTRVLRMIEKFDELENVGDLAKILTDGCRSQGARTADAIAVSSRTI